MFSKKYLYISSLDEEVVDQEQIAHRRIAALQV